MKKGNKNSQMNGLPIRNHRWQWMAGAAAGAVAGMTAQATEQTVDLSDNYISASGGNHLNADLTGDGVADITITDADHSTTNAQIGTYQTTTHSTFTDPGFPTTSGFSTPVVSTRSSYRQTRFAGVTIDGVKALAKFAFDTHRSTGSTQSTASVDSSSTTNNEPSEITQTIEIQFDGDPLINAGASTPGTLQVEAITDGSGEVEVELLSYSYDQTILAPYQAIEAARATLEALLSSQNNHRVQESLQSAITYLGNSLSQNNWQAGDTALNNRTGENVFSANASVISTLTSLTRVSGVPSHTVTEINVAIALLAQADIQLATTALESDHGQGNPRDLATATKDLALANTAFEAGKDATANTDAGFVYQAALEAKEGPGAGGR